MLPASPPAARESTPQQASAPDDAVPHVGVQDVWRAARNRRRALRVEMRRFTARSRRRRAVLLGVLAAVVVLVAGTFGVSYSPLFAVQTIRVTGTQGMDAAAVQHALRAELGTPLPLVSEASVTRALSGFPRVQSYSLQARPPHELVVRIVERTPVGVVKTPRGYALVDPAGVTLGTAAAVPKGQPLITARGGVHSDAFRAAGDVLRTLPASLRGRVAAVSAATPDDVTLTLTGGRTTVVWGGADDSAMKALVLQKIMRARPPAGVRVYDVSAPAAVVVR